MSAIRAERQRSNGGWRPILLGLLLVLMPAVMPGAALCFGQQAAKPVTSTLTPAASPAPVKAARPGTEGLKVHGYWVIDVKNPDGTVAQHREFENSLLPSGQLYLLQMMAGYTVATDYAILLQTNTGNPAPCGTSFLADPTLPAGCTIVHSDLTAPGNNSCTHYACSQNLTYAFSLTLPYTMTLAGSFTASQAGVIASVVSVAGACPGNLAGTINPAITNTSPASCVTKNQSPSIDFTSYTLPVPINVASGQVVQVSVTISFS